MRKLAIIEAGKVVNVIKAPDPISEAKITDALQKLQGRMMADLSEDGLARFTQADIDLELAQLEESLRLDKWEGYPLVSGAGIGWTYDAETGEFAEPERVETFADLSRRQFEFLLALTGFGEVWDALTNAAKAANDLTTYAGLKAERAGSTFRHDVTLITVGTFRDTAAVIAPTVDLSDEAINAAWKLAENFRGVSSA